MTLDLLDLAALHPATRAELLLATSKLPAMHGPSPALTAALRTVRDALRERHPIRPDRLAVEVLVGLDPHRWYVEGLLDAPAGLSALSPEGELVALAAEVDSDGRFACHFETRSPSSDKGWVFTAAARGEEVEAPEVNALTRDRVLAESATTAFGVAPTAPDVSIIVLLGTDGDLLEHHLAQLCGDPKGHDAELICVLDGPCDPDQARERAEQLYELYGRAMCLIVLPARGGVRLMREAGAVAASGRALRFRDTDDLLR
jgi:hypothetical protein